MYVVRVYRRVLADRLHRGSEEDQRARAGDAWRGRPDRTLRRFRAAVGQASEERHFEILQGFPHGMPTTEVEQRIADYYAFGDQRTVSAAVCEHSSGEN